MSLSNLRGSSSSSSVHGSHGEFAWGLRIALELAASHDSALEALVVKEASPATAHQLLLLVLLGVFVFLNLGGLTTHLAGTGERTVNLSCCPLLSYKFCFKKKGLVWELGKRTEWNSEIEGGENKAG